jgi:hypothetical protein
MAPLCLSPSACRPSLALLRRLTLARSPWRLLCSLAPSPGQGWLQLRREDVGRFLYSVNLGLYGYLFFQFFILSVPQCTLLIHCRHGCLFFDSASPILPFPSAVLLPSSCFLCDFMDRRRGFTNFRRGSFSIAVSSVSPI